MSTSPPSRPGVFISWINEFSRSEGLARALGIEALFMTWARPRQPKLTKLMGWLRSGMVTWRTVRQQPEGALVVLMVPPIWSPLVAMLARPRGVRLVFDMHSGARDAPKWAWSWPILQWMMRRVDAVVVTNMEILDGAQMGSCRPVVIIDPTLAADAKEPEPVSPEVPLYGVFPASGDHDEPIDALADAADILQGEVEIAVTGRPPERVHNRNLRITGYLDVADYRKLLNGASFVLALTTQPATNQRAASEAVQRGIPVVCTDTTMLRATYGGAAVFVQNDTESLVQGIRQVLADRDKLVDAMPLLVRRLRAESRAGVEQLMSL